MWEFAWFPGGSEGDLLREVQGENQAGGKHEIDPPRVDR